MREKIEREVHAYLDGDVERERLPAELHEAAERWDEVLAAASASASRSAPAWLEAGVMRELRADCAPSRLPAWVEWLLRPRTIRVAPLAAGLAAAALVLVALRPWSGPPGGASGHAPSVYVQFVAEAPAARSVALAGDFNGWKPTIALRDPEGDGVWSARVPLEPGVHEYMFVLDGSEWITDPYAARWTDDGFGNRNAVVAVAGPADGT